MDCITREAIEIELSSITLNREDGLCLSKSGRALICSLQEYRKPPSWDFYERGFHQILMPEYTALIGARNFFSGYPSA
jgi:hypothetical protein